MFDGEGKEKNLRFEDQLCRRGGGGGGIPNNGPYESRNGADSEYRLFPSFHVNISTAPNRAADYVSKNMISQRCHNDEAHLPI